MKITNNQDLNTGQAVAWSYFFINLRRRAKAKWSWLLRSAELTKWRLLVE